MKKTGIILLGSALLFTACKKEHTVMPETKAKNPFNALARKASSTLTEQVHVSDRGYLVLPDSNAYADYLNFLDSNSIEDIAAFHASIGFSSQAGVEGQAGNYIAPSVHNGEYVFSQTGMVQVGNILYRGVNSEGYFLAMPVSSLNDASYAAIVAKEFNPNMMCRLKVGSDYGENLEAFVSTHIGYDDPVTPPKTPVVCERKITHTYSGGGVTIVDESWYFLGIRYKHVITIYDGRP